MRLHRICLIRQKCYFDSALCYCHHIIQRRTVGHTAINAAADRCARDSDPITIIFICATSSANAATNLTTVYLAGNFGVFFNGNTIALG